MKEKKCPFPVQNKKLSNWNYKSGKINPVMQCDRIEISIPVTPQVCQRALHRQYEAPADCKILNMEMGEELVYNRTY